MPQYLTQFDALVMTISGCALGRARDTADPVAITPANRATAALYTYTPWVLRGQGGNWLFWNVYRKFASYLLEEMPNHHWIGGHCDGGCPYADGQCTRDLLSTNESEMTHFCTAPCARYCPDSMVPYTSQTFCVDLLSGPNEAAESGYCVAKCSDELYPANGGCADGLECVRTARFGEPDVTAEVCLPRDQITAETTGESEPTDTQ